MVIEYCSAFLNWLSLKREIRAEPVHFQAVALEGILHPRQALAAHGPGSRSAADHLWSNENQQAIDKATGQETRCHFCATFAEDRVDSSVRKAAQRVCQVWFPVLSRNDDRLRSCAHEAGECVSVRGFTRDENAVARFCQNTCIEPEARTAVKDDAQWIARCSPRDLLIRVQPNSESGVIRKHRSDADHHGVRGITKPVDISARFQGCHPARITGLGGDFPVEGHRHLQDYKGKPGPLYFQVSFIHSSRGRCAYSNHDFNPCISKATKACAAHPWIRVGDGGNDTPNSGPDQGVSAGRCSPPVGTWLERNVNGAPDRCCSSTHQGDRLGMRLSNSLVISFRDHRAVGAKNHTAHRGIGRRAPPPFLGLPQSG